MYLRHLTVVCYSSELQYTQQDHNVQTMSVSLTMCNVTEFN